MKNFFVAVHNGTQPSMLVPAPLLKGRHSLKNSSKLTLTNVLLGDRFARKNSRRHKGTLIVGSLSDPKVVVLVYFLKMKRLRQVMIQLMFTFAIFYNTG